MTGCSKISAGCFNCYAERMANRLRAMGVERYRDGFKLRLHEDLLTVPLKWRAPRMVFVNSMSDLFHENVPLAFIERVFRVMNECPQHTFQVLTKRAERLKRISSQIEWTNNIWMGVTVENADNAYRIDCLAESAARVRFLSCEPLIGPLKSVRLHNIDWVIVGGESGPGARPMLASWATSLRDQCEAAAVPYFFKQWGGFNKKRNGRLLDGRTWDEMPVPATS